MAIYHLHVKVIGRKAGSSAVASAAYRSASRLGDERLDRTHDFSVKRGVIHSEVLLPENAPEHLGDRERLWNDVEAFEVRKDAQLAREVEFALPREMSEAQGIALARDFVQSEFVDQGMIADLNVHWDIGEDGMPKPHAHVMLTMRSVDEQGFGPKVRDWNRTEMVERWRQRWAELANDRLAELDIDARIDHRSLEAQGIALEPQSQIGAPAKRIEDRVIELEGSRPPRVSRTPLPTGPNCTARSPAATATGSSPILPLHWTRSRTSNRPSRGATWRSSHTGTATASSSSTR